MTDSDKNKAQSITELTPERKQIEDELKRDRNLIRSLLETANSLIFCLDKDARITIFNDECERITGYKRDEVIGKSWPELFLPKDNPAHALENFGDWVRQHPEDSYEGPLITKSGRIKTILWTNSAMFLPDSDEITAIAIGQDITERKNTENALRESEERFRELTELLPQTVFEIDTIGNLTFTNRFGFEFTGYTQKDLDEGINILQIFSPEESEKVKTNLKKRLAGDTAEGHEYILVSKDGRLHPVLIYSNPIIREGTTIGLRGVVLDISKHKKIEEELLKFKTISDKASYGTAISDPEGNLLYVNECFAGMHGYTTDELIGKNLFFFHNDEQMPDVNRLLDSLRRQSSFSAEKVWHTRKDGTVFPTLMNASVIKDDNGGPMFLSATAIDITELEMAQIALVDSELRFKTQYHSIPVPTYTWRGIGDDFVLIDCNDKAMEETGGKISSKFGIKFTDMYPGWKDGLEDMKRCFREKKTVNRQTWYTYVSTGEKRFLDVSIVFIPPDMAMIHVIDLTDRIRIEKSLRESKEKWRSLVENAPHNILTVDREGKVLFINRTSSARTPADVIGNKIYDYIRPEYHEHIHNTITKVLRTGKPDSFESRGLDEYGGKWYINQIGPIKNESKTKSVLIIATDVTKRKHAEARSRARLRLLNDLRQTRDIDECLNLGCRAIYEAELFGRAVLTLHNEKREITNLGFIGLDEQIVRAARSSPAPDEKLARSMTREEYKISKSYFVPIEASLHLNKTPRHISQKQSGPKSDSAWKVGDELFVPIMGNGKKYEGWLSVDTPVNGKRPTRETVEILEEIIEIVTQQVREMRILDELHQGHMELQTKNIALREVLGHIEEEKIAIKRQVAENIDQVLLPALKKVRKTDGSINPYYLELISDGLKDLAETSGGLLRSYASLSPREVEVCNMIKGGATTKEIAGELFITIGTVKRHREMIRKKLGIKNKDINLSTHLKNL